MRGVILLVIILTISFSKNIYSDYVNKLINYRFELDKNISFPFEKRFRSKNVLNFTKRVSLEPLNILNNRAYVIIYYYVGKNLVKTEKKWVKKGDKIDDCYINEIGFYKLVYSCKNKKEIKTLNKPIKILFKDRR